MLQVMQRRLILLRRVQHLMMRLCRDNGAENRRVGRKCSRVWLLGRVALGIRGQEQV
jgi:hypothetical protein